MQGVESGGSMQRRAEGATLQELAYRHKLGISNVRREMRAA
jgi:hypothetical protein